MTDRVMQSLSGERCRLGVLAALCLLLFFLDLGGRPFWDLDEAKHAVVAKEMVQGGDWIVPRFNHEPFFDKPILHYWLAAAGFRLFGMNEAAARLPSALLGVGLVLLTYVLGRMVRGPVVGFWAAAVFATCMETVVLSRTIVHDQSLCFFTTLTLVLFYAGLRDERRRTRCYLGAYAAAGVAVLAKGPVGALLPAMVAFLYALVQGRLLETLRSARLLAGIPVLLAVAAPWYVAVSLQNPDFGGHFFLTQNVMRFVSQEARHSEAFYFYIPVLLAGVFPWTFILLVCAGWLARMKRAVWRSDLGFPLIWAVSILLFFSAASSKLPTYIFPAFPALAVLIGAMMADFIAAPTRRLKLWLEVAWIIMIDVAVFGVLYVALVEHERLMDEAGIPVWPVLLIGSLFIIGHLATLALLWWRQTTLAFGGAVATMVVTLALILEVVMPFFDGHRSSRDLVPRLGTYLRAGQPVTFYRRIKESVLFYSDRRAELINRRLDLRDYLRSSNSVYVIVEERSLGRVSKLGRVVENVGGKVILTNPDDRP